MTRYNLLGSRQQDSQVNSNITSKSNVKCAIIYDTDFPNIGLKTEKNGKVFYHSQMKPILGFKAMFLCFTDVYSVPYRLLSYKTEKRKTE